MRELIVLLFVATSLMNSLGQTNRKVIFNTQIFGSPISCTGTGPNKLYEVNHFNRQSLTSVEKLVWTCGDAGVFVESNATSYTVLPDTSGDIFNHKANVNWVSNNTTSWVQATYHWTFLGFHNTSTAMIEVKIGVIGNPTAIITPSICINQGGSYIVTCPNSLPFGASGYLWSATNATISGTGATATLVPIANTSDIIVSVRFHSASCNTQSNAFSKTIIKSTAPPTVGPSFSPVITIKPTSTNSKKNITVNFPSLSFPYSWSCNITGVGVNTVHSGDNKGSITFLMTNNNSLTITSSASNGCGKKDGSSYFYQLVNGALVPKKVQ